MLAQNSPLEARMTKPRSLPPQELHMDQPYEPVPDDDTPTTPELNLPECPSCHGVLVLPLCRACGGTGVVQ